MTKGFIAALSERILLFDGGMGSMLIAAGLGEGQPPEAWNLSRPEVLVGIHRRYLEAGADVIQTNTFGANQIKLACSWRGEAHDPDEVVARGVEAARRALDEHGDPDRFLAGEIGPTGEFFAPMGALTAERARAAFRRQADVLERCGVDLFLIETMYDLREALEAVRAVREISDRPLVCELTMERRKRGFFTIVGDSPAAAAAALPEAGADVIGANCSVTSAEMIDLAAEMRALTSVPLIFQPNAGQPEIISGQAVYRQTPEEFAADMLEVARAGAGALGGCCGTTPEFIRALRAGLDKEL